MKKLLCIAAAASLLAASAAIAEEVYSVNIVGFQKVELPAAQFILASMNFEAGDNTLLDVFGTDMLKQDNNMLACDRILVYDPVTQTYQAWAQWTDGVFYKANNMDEWAAGIAGNPEIPIGSGFFIASGNTSEANILSFTGDVVMDETVPIAIAEGFQLLGYPFSSDIALQDTSFFADGSTASGNMLAADRVHIYEGGDYQAYAIYTDGVWYKANNLDEWAAGIVAENIIRVGEGFFYEARNPMTWEEENKYLHSINN